PKRPKARREFDQSDALTRLATLPDDRALQARATLLEKAVALGDPRSVKATGESILGLLAQTYEVSQPRLRVLGTRPRTAWEGGHSELFGDYDFEEKRIRIWMRTAVLGKVTSSRGLLHPLLHEFCHHLDREGFGFLETAPAGGFHARADTRDSEYDEEARNRVRDWIACTRDADPQVHPGRKQPDGNEVTCGASQSRRRSAAEPAPEEKEDAEQHEPSSDDLDRVHRAS